MPQSEAVNPVRILFVGEAVAMAHVSRPLVLAEAMSALGYDVHFASSAHYSHLLAGSAIPFHELESIDADHFVRRASRGDAAYLPADAMRYAAAEDHLLDAIRPDLVVSDFRYSAPVSAHRVGAASAVLVNAHWSPHRKLPFPVEPPAPAGERRPPLDRLRHSRPATLATNAVRRLMPRGSPEPDDIEAFNVLRRARWLPTFSSYEELITGGDHVLYVDPPSLVSVGDLPDHHRFIGPVVWSPPVPLPDWWESLPTDRPLVYVTAGSTGDVDRVRRLITGLRASGIGVLLATAGRLDIESQGDGLWSARMLPGPAVCQRVAAVVCNGGSATAYQAIAAGRPIVGLWTNKDQYYTSRLLAERGASLAVSAAEPEASALDAVRRVITEPSFTAAASILAEEITRWDATRQFAAFVAEQFGGPHRQTSV